MSKSFTKKAVGIFMLVALVFCMAVSVFAAEIETVDESPQIRATLPVNQRCAIYSAQSGSARYLNIAASGNVTGRTNVTTYADTGNATQRWTIVPSIDINGLYHVFSQQSNEYSLNIARTNNNADVVYFYTNNGNGGKDRSFKFVAEGSYFGIVIPADPLCLTATSTSSNGKTVNWQASNSQTNQLWYVKQLNLG